MKYFKEHVLPFLIITTLIGTFTALAGGAREVIEYIVCYLFWMGMLAPLLIGEQKKNDIIPLKYRFNEKTGQIEKV